jgi:hypothetical protein
MIPAAAPAAAGIMTAYGSLVAYEELQSIDCVCRGA